MIVLLAGPNKNKRYFFINFEKAQSTNNYYLIANKNKNVVTYTKRPIK